MTLTRIQPLSRTDSAIEKLTQYVHKTGLKIGDQLPSNRDLAEGLGVSRPILREALRHLAALGIVESRIGSGTYLRRAITPNEQHIIMRFEAERQSLMEIHELRRAIEVEVAGLAATRATDSDIKELEELVDALEQEFIEKGQNPKTDKAFHLALYRYARNPLFLQFMQPLWDHLDRFWHQPLGRADFAEESLPYYRKVFEGIRQRHPEQAREAMLKLLMIVEEDLHE